jgi:immune inhibitor A
VHAGGDQAADDPQQGTDAIWSHRWYAQLTPIGSGGPAGLAPFGGVEIGEGGASSGVTIPNNRTGVWVGDYTIQPENGGLGVFAHEFGHDLGLPDLYDTSGNTGGAENSTAFWTLMSSGANIGSRSRNGIGDAPTDMGAWEKFQLGWLGCDACAGGRFYEVVPYGSSAKLRLGPANGATRVAQAVIVPLPDKRVETTITAPAAGAYLYYSGSGNDLSNTMTKAVTLPAGASLTADVWYDTEEGYDFAFLEVSSDNGATWTPVVTNLSSPAADDQSGFNSSGAGITGSTNGAYVALTADLSAFSGNVLLRFRYQTDPAVAGQGFVVDNIAVTGNPLDGAEDENAGWTFDGFIRSTGTEISFHFNAYIGENRGYRGYDRSLRTAYNFGFLNTSRPDWVEHYPYQDGLLISYWDESFGDNNVGDHPGGGLILPVDAHPKPLHWSDGTLARQRIQSYDSTFGEDRTDSITLHKDGVPTRFHSQAAVRTFDDLKTWWYANDEHDPATHGRYQVGWTGVDVPKTGTTIRVRDTSPAGFYIDIEVRPSH